jgi:Flp pilus assembly protein TadG
MMFPKTERSGWAAHDTLRLVCGRCRSLASRLAFLRRAGEQGQALVEMAVVAPCLLLITFGMCVFGIGLNEQLVLTNAVQQGAQVLAVSRGVSDPCSTAATAVENASPSLKSASMTWTITVGGTSYTTTTCTGAASAMTAGANISVEVKYPFTATFILFGTKSYTLDAVTQEIVE